ncbi:MAG: hypothetical protein HND52_00760 [Ignavibacteriae bacterium]|nr:hypothetical protein [Ignavibacteriota bacterium]NOG96478.1 hypothetical protein [Ignavibacteriota bacterium]
MKFEQIVKYLKFLNQKCNKIIDDNEVSDDELQLFNSELIKFKQTVRNDNSFSELFVELIESLRLDLNTSSHSSFWGFFKTVTFYFKHHWSFLSYYSLDQKKRIVAFKKLSGIFDRLLWLIREDKVFKPKKLNSEIPGN